MDSIDPLINVTILMIGAFLTLRGHGYFVFDADEAELDPKTESTRKLNRIMGPLVFAVWADIVRWKAALN